MSKNRQMNIRLSDADYEKIQLIASQTNKQHQIDSPLRYAEKSLESLNQSLKNRAMPKDELEALKAQRATLEANVEEAKQKQVVEQPKKEQKNKNGTSKIQVLAFKMNSQDGRLRRRLVIVC